MPQSAQILTDAFPIDADIKPLFEALGACVKSAEV